ncbi:MAG: DNA-3-methyladenine glycosylase I [Paludibacter sp.]|nr:DNA-3-methyladenine glycosylase I [Paludibacter sp.]
MKKRCEWAGDDPLMIEYHDREWGVPIHDDRLLFEFLILEGAQAGLSWSTILKKRDNYRMAFDNFDPAKVAEYRTYEVETLLTNSGIVRNRRKIEAAIANANAFLQVQEEFGSFDAYIWCFVDGTSIKNGWNSWSEIPSSTPESDCMSLDLKKRGFKFVGPIICYAFMQAVGMVNDHIVYCFRYGEIP